MSWRIVGKLVLAAILITAVLLLYRSNVDFVYTGF